MTGPQPELFSETQHFRQWWLVLLLAGLVVVTWGVALSLALNGLFTQQDFWLNVVYLVWFVLFGALLPFFLLVLDLETRVDATGVYYRFAPWQRTFLVLARTDITNVESIEYGFLTYGGYGIRMGRGLRVYNVSGHTALRFGLNSGNTVVIGTQRPLEFLTAVQTMLSSTRL